MSRLVAEDLTRSIIGSFFDVYNHFGYGLLESVYMGGLEVDLVSKGHQVVRELMVPVHYRDHLIGWQRLDLVVDETVIVEIKATEKLPPSAQRQLLTYLKTSRFEVGLLLHFGLRADFQRFIMTRSSRG